MRRRSSWPSQRRSRWTDDPAVLLDSARLFVSTSSVEAAALRPITGGLFASHARGVVRRPASRSNQLAERVADELGGTPIAMDAARAGHRLVPSRRRCCSRSTATDADPERARDIAQAYAEKASSELVVDLEPPCGQTATQLIKATHRSTTRRASSAARSHRSRFRNLALAERS